MNECQVWWTITGNFGNMMPIDWSKSTTRAKQLPTLNLVCFSFKIYSLLLRQVNFSQVINISDNFCIKVICGKFPHRVFPIVYVSVSFTKFLYLYLKILYFETFQFISYFSLYKVTRWGYPCLARVRHFEKCVEQSTFEQMDFEQMTPFHHY